MATLRDIQRRIRSVQKTQQITSAMRMVAAAKLRRAQDAIIAARPYAEKIYTMLANVSERQGETEHTLLEERPKRRTLEVVVVTSDRGLCGAFNSNILKVADAFIRERSTHFESVVVSCVGRKADEYVRRRHADRAARSWTGIPNVAYGNAVEIADHLSTRFRSEEIDEAAVVYSEFVSALTQTPRELPVLPFRAPAGSVTEDAAPFAIEPSPEALFQALVPRALEFTIFRALLENQAGEHAARMTSMEAATRNTEDLIRSLTLQFNRARQAAITKELVEIVTGAQALEG
jgi:F-type H+-transporting ATPase subunit gamma